MDKLARAAFGLGITVSDYNAKLTDNFSDIQEATLHYTSVLKQLRKEGIIDDDKLPLLLSLVGEAWGALVLR